MIDLDDLAGLCPGLPAESAAPLAFRAVVALERRHGPGTRLQAKVRGEPRDEAVYWQKLPPTVEPTQDSNRATEEGAVAIALALAARHCRWSVVRCLQSRLAEGADWLMIDAANQQVVLEVGGTDEGSLNALLAKKTRQARGSLWAKRGMAAACVVRFLEPQAVLWSDDESR